MTFRSKPENSIVQQFEREFSLEILKSDRLRVTILMCALASAVLIGPLLSVFAVAYFQAVFRGRFKMFMLTFFVIMVVTLSCLALERSAISRLIKEQDKGRPWLQYVSAFIETSIPSIALIATSFFMPPIYALYTPAPFVYGLLIVLSTLRLNFKLCVFTGAVAMVEYILISWVFISRSDYSSLDPIFVET